jgi:cholesterol transport system auxiliary component
MGQVSVGTGTGPQASAAMRHARALLAVAALSVALSGCSLLGGGPTPLTTYDLSSPEGVRSTRAVTVQVLVPEPVALKALDTERIVVRPSASEITYYPGAQWSDRLPRLVQNRLVQTFETSTRIRAGTPGQGLSIDYQVITDLRDFDYDATRKVGHVEISVKLMNDHDGKVVATELFSGEAPVASDTAASVTAALDAALETQMKAIVGWTAKRI